jgi:hypothetical protein
VAATNTGDGRDDFRRQEREAIAQANGPLLTFLDEQFVNSIARWGPDFSEEVIFGQMVGYHILRGCCESAHMPTKNMDDIRELAVDTILVNNAVNNAAKLGLAPPEDITAFDLVWEARFYASPSLQELASRFGKTTTRSGAKFIFLLFQDDIAEVQAP